MRTLFFLICLLAGSIAQAENISKETPSRYFQNNPEDISKFIKTIDANPNYTEDEKAIYKKDFLALARPDKDSNGNTITGDVALDQIDPATVRWFYGINPDNERTAGLNKNKLVHKASKQTSKTDEFACFDKPLCVHVSLGQQRMFAYYYGKPIKGIHNTKISSGRNNNTPTGTFTIDELANEDRVVRRDKWKGAALYWAMQLDGHIFIHSTSPENYKYLGTKASGGCIRTTKEIAGKLNNLMRQIGGRKNGVLHDKSQVMAIVTSY